MKHERLDDHLPLLMVGLFTDRVLVRVTIDQ